jgi:sn-glycerol 3-phosphate transport system substrate-binding protein
MRRTAVFIILLTFIFAFTSTASAKTKIRFFYPVGVAGPLVKVINGMVAEFEKENPDIKPPCWATTLPTLQLSKSRNCSL